MMGTVAGCRQPRAEKGGMDMEVGGMYLLYWPRWFRRVAFHVFGAAEIFLGTSFSPKSA